MYDIFLSEYCENRIQNLALDSQFKDSISQLYDNN
jgi:hypothetical protein